MAQEKNRAWVLRGRVFGRVGAERSEVATEECWRWRVLLRVFGVGGIWMLGLCVFCNVMESMRGTWIVSV